jgi:hypothetical protein
LILNLNSNQDIINIVAIYIQLYRTHIPSKMSSYNPGTLFRLYSNDESQSISFPVKPKHYTAVLLKDGKVLEVKNPDTGLKNTFDSLEAWQLVRPDCTLKADESKSSGVVIGSDTVGFNYPTEKHNAYKWIQWCYSIVKEAAPQLLKSEEFKAAYNNMVELCTKHKQELSDWRRYSSGIYRYSPDNILVVTNKNQWRGEMSGFPGRFQYQNYSYSPYSGLGHKRYTKEDYDKTGTEIGAAYVAIVNIIKPEIESYMTKKYNVAKTEKDISNSKALIKRYEKKVSKLQNEIDCYKSYIQKDTATLAKLEEEFISSKMAAV